MGHRQSCLAVMTMVGLGLVLTACSSKNSLSEGGKDSQTATVPTTQSTGSPQIDSKLKSAVTSATPTALDSNKNGADAGMASSSITISATSDACRFASKVTDAKASR